MAAAAAAASAQRSASPHSNATIHSFGVTGVCPFSRLSYFDMSTMTMLDMMHIGANVINQHHLIGAITGNRLSQARLNQEKLNQKQDEMRWQKWSQAEESLKKFQDQLRKLETRNQKIINKRNSTGRRSRTAEEAEEKRDNEIRAKRYQIEDCIQRQQDIDDEYEKLVADRPRAMGEFIDLWHIPKGVQQMIEIHAYFKIIAPPGIAPRTKRPFTVPTEMTSHQWYGFIRVYGKFLFAQRFSGQNLQVLCDIIDLVKSCVLSRITPSTMRLLRDQVQKVATHMVNCFPSTEWSMMLHLLCFHMPDTIEYWGPARSYWCFPFERSAYPTCLTFFQLV